MTRSSRRLKPWSRVALTAAVGFAVFLTGCLQGLGPGDGLGEGHEQSCIVSVSDRWDPPARLNLSWEVFQESAPNLATQFAEERANWTKPYDLGGNCDEFEPDLVWLAMAFQDSGTEPYEPIAGAEFWFFGLVFDDQEIEFNLYGPTARNLLKEHEQHR